MDMQEAYATYAALQAVRPPSPPMLPAFTIQHATGPRDATGKLHGAHCTLVSVMGFTYCGACEYGQLAGHGTLTWRNGHTVTGVFDAATGTVSGHARLTWPNGDVYEGEVLHGIRHGHGTLTSLPYEQQKQVRRSCQRAAVSACAVHPRRATTAAYRERTSQLRDAQGDDEDGVTAAVVGAEVYVGEWQHGMRHGRGRQRYANGSVYDGEWRHNERDGDGCMRYCNGDCYEGAWRRGEQHGAGAMGWRHLQHGSKDDDVDDNKVAGNDGGPTRGGGGGGAGVYTELYHGEWRHGLPHGQGIATFVRSARTSRAAHDAGTSAREHHARRDGCSQSCSSEEDNSNNNNNEAEVDEHDAECASARPAHYAPPAHAVLNVYRGQWARGERDGRGVFYYADGSCYSGRWRGGRRCGRGVHTTAMGQRRVCHYNNNDSSSNTDDNEHGGGGGDDGEAAGAGVGAARNAKERAVVTATDGAVPRVCVADLRRLADVSVAALQTAVASLLLRYHTTLLGLFTRYAQTCAAVAFAVTAADWWQHRLPGHVTVAQLLRLLSDARVLDGVVCTATVLSCVADVLRHEHDGKYNSNSSSSKDDDDGDDDDDSASECDAAVLQPPHGVRTGDGGDEEEAGSHTRLSAQLARLSRLDGELNYRQYVEVLVRLSPHVCVGACFASLSDTFAALVDNYLQRCYVDGNNNSNSNSGGGVVSTLPLSPRPLYTQSRACVMTGVLTPSLVQTLTTQFARLAQPQRHMCGSDAKGNREATRHTHRPSSSSAAAAALLLLPARRAVALLMSVAAVYALRTHDVLRQVLLPLLLPLHALRDAAGDEAHVDGSRSASSNTLTTTTTTMSASTAVAAGVATRTATTTMPLPSHAPALPPGYNQPARLLARELLAASCGDSDTLLLSAMTVQQQLTLMDYVEVVVGVAALRARHDACALDTTLLQSVMEDMDKAADACVCDTYN